MSSDLYAVIMAGGVGTRFWPLSRRSLPKQFLAIGGGERSLLRATYERLVELTDPQRILVIGNERYRRRTLEEIPELSEENFVGEPQGRNTAPCIGLAAHVVRRRDPGAALLVTPADHVIEPEAEFCSTVRFADELLRNLERPDDPATVTLGISPSEPATGYGYIEQGVLIETSGELHGFRVASFKEKPHLETARGYLETGRFLWNSGIFLWTVEGVLRLIEKHIPELARGLTSLSSQQGDKEGFRVALEQQFGSLPSISVDYGVLERARNVACVRASFSWDDVGSWNAAARYLKEDASGSRVRGRHLGIDTRDCVVVGNRRLLATLGVENLVIVDTEDALLVCRRDEVERVKDLVERVECEGYDDVL